MGEFFFNMFLLYFALPVAMCSLIGAVFSIFGIGLAVGITTVFVNIALFMLLSEVMTYGMSESLYLMPALTAIGGTVLTGAIGWREQGKESY